MYRFLLLPNQNEMSTEFFHYFKPVSNPTFVFLQQISKFSPIYLIRTHTQLNKCLQKFSLLKVDIFDLET